MQQWNVEIQREVLGGMVIDIADAGSKGPHRPGPSQALNQLPVEFLSQGAALTQQVPNPFPGQVQLEALAQPTLQRAQLLRPFPRYTGFDQASPMNRNSVDQSVQVKVEKRFA